MPDPLEKASPIIKSLFEGEARRIVQMYRVYEHLKSQNIDNPNIWVGKMIQRAETSALVNLLIKKGIITADEFLNGAADKMREATDLTEKDLNVLITTEGVYPREPKEKEQRGKRDGR